MTPDYQAGDQLMVTKDFVVAGHSYVAGTPFRVVSVDDLGLPIKMVTIDSAGAILEVPAEFILANMTKLAIASGYAEGMADPMPTTTYELRLDDEAVLCMRPSGNGQINFMIERASDQPTHDLHDIPRNVVIDALRALVHQLTHLTSTNRLLQDAVAAIEED